MIDPFQEWDKNFDADKIAMEESAKVIADLFKQFKEQGLSTFEAAQMVAAMIANSGNTPGPPQINNEDE